ncbi:MAG: OadG family transporter subunit [Desulfobacteraceae bacterium]|jgi:sodium pump decarboxylase gamma subunit
MVVEGIKLAVTGMLIVFIFLILLVLVVQLSARLLRSYTQQEEREQARYKRKSSAGSPLADSRLIAVIAAAVSAHRKKMRIVN